MSAAGPGRVRPLRRRAGLRAGRPARGADSAGGRQRRGPAFNAGNATPELFLPSLRTNASGASWAGGSTHGTSLPMSTFYVAKPGESAATINTAFANGCNVFFTPGVYRVNQTLHVTKANTVVLGIGYPTIIPDGGVNAMDVADVDGVRLKGLLFDAGTTNTDTLLPLRARPSLPRPSPDLIQRAAVFSTLTFNNVN